MFRKRSFFESTSSDDESVNRLDEVATQIVHENFSGTSNFPFLNPNASCSSMLPCPSTSSAQPSCANEIQVQDLSSVERSIFFNGVEYVMKGDILVPSGSGFEARAHSHTSSSHLPVLPEWRYAK